MSIRMKRLFVCSGIVAAVVSVFLYAGHKKRLAKQAATPPYALCTIKSIEADFGRKKLYIETEMQVFNVASWGNYGVYENEISTDTKFWLSGGGTDSHKYGEKVNAFVGIEFRKPGFRTSLLDEFESSLFYEGFYGLPDQFACDWRNPTTLLEVGKTYKITPEKPLLIARGTEPGGMLYYHWLTVSPHSSLTDTKVPAYHLDQQAQQGYATNTKPEVRYWLTHAEYDPDSNRVLTQFAWLGKKPNIDFVSKRLNPEFCWVEDSKIISEPIEIEVSGAFSNGTQTADMTITLPEVPENAPDDVWLRMNFSKGSDDHRLVEIPVRRRTFFGEEYPLGTRMVWRNTRLYKNRSDHRTIWDMHNFRFIPQLGCILAYGRSIYQLDLDTGVRTTLWEGPPIEQTTTLENNYRVVGCDVTSDGKYLVFLYGPSGSYFGTTEMHILDLKTLGIVGSSRTQTAPRLYIDQDNAVIYTARGNGKSIAIRTASWPHLEHLNAISLNHAHEPAGHQGSPIQYAIVSDTQRAGVLYDCGCLVAYDIKTGAELWNTTVSFSSARELQLSSDGKEVRVSSMGGLDCLTFESGALQEKIALNIPYFNRSTKLSDTFGMKELIPIKWAWSQEKKLLAAEIGSWVLSNSNGFFIFDAMDSFKAKQCISKYFTEPGRDFRWARMKPIGFIDENLLLVKCRRLSIDRTTDATELICIDLREVPEI